MKVKLRKPVNWFGPYQLAETLCFWAKKEKDEFGYEREPDWVHNFGTFLAGENHDTFLAKFLQWFHDLRQKMPWNKDVIEIDYWDVWSMDHTLSPIILPMLKQLKAVKHGSGHVDDEDVPNELRSIHALPKEPYDTDGNWHKRWDYVLDEMIWAFEQLNDENHEAQFWKERGEIDWESFKKPFAEGEKTRELKWKSESVVDWDGLKAHNERIDNGTRLFGKYFRGLWD